MPLNKQISELDISILRFIHHNRITALDEILYYISFATTFVSISILILVLIGSIKNSSTERMTKFFLLLSILILAGISSLCLKYTLVRERPFVTYSDIKKLSEAGNSSFPSGHTIEAFAVAFAVSSLFPKRKYIIPVFLWALLIAYSRMALGVHYPSDILSGIFISLIVSYFTIRFLPVSLLQKK
jgi:undecaprenyl-diphosphatase